VKLKVAGPVAMGGGLLQVSFCTPFPKIYHILLSFTFGIF